jgi:hypothetical protein
MNAGESMLILPVDIIQKVIKPRLIFILNCGAHWEMVISLMHGFYIRVTEESTLPFSLLLNNV